MIKTDSLRHIYLFKEMTPEELGKIAKVSDLKEVIAGQDVFFVGQKAQSFFVIQQGTIKIFTTTSEGDEVRLTSLATGSHFGEMPFLNEDVRSATAQATETSHLIEIPYEGLRKLLIEDMTMSDKFHRALSRFLALRLKETTSDFNRAKETMMKHY